MEDVPAPVRRAWNWEQREREKFFLCKVSDSLAHPEHRVVFSENSNSVRHYPPAPGVNGW